MNPFPSTYGDYKNCIRKMDVMLGTSSSKREPPLIKPKGVDPAILRRAGEAKRYDDDDQGNVEEGQTEEQEASAAKRQRMSFIVSELIARKSGGGENQKDKSKRG